MREFDMRIPVELDRDADVVISEIVKRLRKAYASSRLLKAFANAHCQDGDILGAYAHMAFDSLDNADDFTDEENDEMLKGLISYKKTQH